MKTGFVAGAALALLATTGPAIAADDLVVEAVAYCTAIAGDFDAGLTALEAYRWDTGGGPADRVTPPGVRRVWASRMAEEGEQSIYAEVATYVDTEIAYCSFQVPAVARDVAIGEFRMFLLAQGGDAETGESGTFGAWESHDRGQHLLARAGQAADSRDVVLELTIVRPRRTE